MMYRIDRDWYSLLHKAEAQSGTAEGQQALETLRQSFVTLAPAFVDMPYFFSEEYSMVDCCMGPLLWRFYALGATFPRQAKAVEAYAERLFDRETFQVSLTETEREMRES